MRKTRQHYIIKSVIISSIIYILLIGSLALTSIYTPVVEEEDGILFEIEELKVEKPDLQNIAEDELTENDRRNIAVNNAMNSRPETDPYDYSKVEKADENYKEQLVKNAISEKEYEKIFEREDINFEEETTPEEKTEIIQKENQPSNFQGSTYISFFLKDRYKMKIPIPTYRCETSGKVIIEIFVNRDGRVVSYEISETASTLDECLRNAALNSVKNSKFNQNYDAPLKQRGTITYIFEAQ